MDFRHAAFLPLLGLIALGCIPQGTFSSIQGHYEGFEIRTATIGNTQNSASGDLSAAAGSSSELELVMNSADSNAGLIFQFQFKNDNELVLSASDQSVKNVFLSRSSGSCFTNGKVGQILLCADGKSLKLDLPSSTGETISFMMERMNGEPAPPLEPPAKYTVAQLMDLAKSQNFDTQIEFQRVVQARLNTESAYLGLLPHFNANDVFNILSFSALTMLKSIGDAVPFLIPSNWMHAKGAKFNSDAEFEAWLLMKADAMNIVEGLSYSVIRDEVTSQRLSDNRVTVSQIRDQIIDLEHTGLFQAGSSDDISAVLNSIDQGTLLLQQKVEEEKSSLSNGSGFFNSSAVSDVELSDTMPEIQGITDLDGLRKVALERSMELRQMDFLIQAAHLGVVSSFFGWLDPTGVGVSATLGVGVSIAKAHEKELMATRNKLEADLIKRVSNAFEQVNDAASAYANAQDGIAIQQRRVQRLRNNLTVGIEISLIDLVSALEATTQSSVAQVDAEFSYYAAVGRLNRLTFEGPYAPVLVDSDSSGNPKPNGAIGL